MLGDWSGLRSDLSKRGIDFEFFYAGTVPNNLNGGLRRGAVYQGGLMMTVDLDSQKLLGYEGGTFHASGLWLHGHEPFSAGYVGDINRVNLLDFPNAARLWEIWYQQKFFASKLAFKIGQLSIDRDFLLPELTGSLGQWTLLNQTFMYPTLPYNLFDIPGLPPRHHGLATTPLATPGTLVRWSPASSISIQAGVYGGAPDQTYSGAKFNLSEREGALSYFELGYSLHPENNSTSLKGSYKLGAYYHTGDFVDVHDGVLSGFANQVGLPGPPLRDRSGNYGAYMLAEQQLFNENGKVGPQRQGLSGFFRLLGAPSDRNLAQCQIDGGLVYKGLIPHRDWDTVAIATSYLGISDDIRRAQRDINTMISGAVPISDHETVFEFSYKIQATAWWTIQPSLQRVLHPGGSSATHDATAFILLSTIRF